METLFRRHFWIFHVVFLAVVAFLAARSVNEVIGHKLRGLVATKSSQTPAQRPAMERARTRNFEAASEANIFGAKRELISEQDVPDNTCTTNKDCPDGVCEDGVCVAVDGPGDDMSDAVKSELRARLVGTAVFSDPQFSLASIIDESAGRDAEAELYSIRECGPEPAVTPPPPSDGEAADPPAEKPQRQPCNELLEVAVVKAIEADRVYLYNNQEKRWEYLVLGEEPEKGGPVVSSRPVRKPRRSRAKDDDLGKGITKVSDTSYTVTQEEVDKALSNLSSLATQARIVPAFEGGEPVGFKLFSIRPNSLYSKIGIQNGDVITRINGYEINSPDKALEVYQKLKDSKSINVDIKRRGKPLTLEYGITP